MIDLTFNLSWHQTCDLNTVLFQVLLVVQAAMHDFSMQCTLASWRHLFQNHRDKVLATECHDHQIIK